MCGIAGFTEYSHSFGGEQTLERMGESIAHRGPDAHGVYYQKNIGLCHRRLSIIDLSEAGKQPMLSHDGQYIIVFNGEIYNYQALRQKLVDEGYPFFSHSDTEVILALYARDGKKMLDKINGQFAFAIWDKNNDSLFIARDRIGKKPLYYHQIDNDIVFASELKALLCLEQIPKNIRLDSVHDFFAYQYIPDPKTIFENIYKLEPGHYLEVDKNGISKHQYWDISFANQSDATETEIKQELQGWIQQCTTSRMISDVPLGAFLSGGVDSSGIVATMAKNSEQPITTCSIGFDTKQFNETEFAKQVARQYHTDHHEYIVHENVKDNLKKIVSYFDEPFADPSLVPTYFVSQLARQKVTVAIAGDGGDEVFAGYEKYSIDHIENKLRNAIPKLIRKNLFPPIESLLSKFDFKLCRKAVTLLNSLQQDAAMGFYLSNAQITDKDWHYITADKTREALGDYHPSNITTGFYGQCDGSDHLAKILYTDMKTYLPGGILVKVDRTSMANSLEVRAPILDYQLIEFAATIPSALKFNKGEKKYILKEAFKDDLPDDILYRKKMGFSVPLAQWLRKEIKELTESTLFQATGGLPDYFNMGNIQNMWDQHQKGQKDNATILWSMLMFQLWWNEYMDETKQAA
jgi:asparagine synthase (glutamine-hydrolysing)